MNWFEKNRERGWSLAMLILTIGITFIILSGLQSTLTNTLSQLNQSCSRGNQSACSLQANIISTAINYSKNT